MLLSTLDRQVGDKMGSSCAADDVVGLVAVGATDEDRPIDEVQTITSSSKGTRVTNEVQYVTTSATIRSEIQVSKYKKRREKRASHNESTVVDISIHRPSFKPMSLSLSRCSLF